MHRPSMQHPNQRRPHEGDYGVGGSRLEGAKEKTGARALPQPGQGDPSVQLGAAPELLAWVPEGPNRFWAPS